MSKLLLPPVESLLKDDAWRDPAPLLARLREHDPVHWVEGLDFWIVTRHRDVLGLFKDARVTADPRCWERYKPPEGEAARWLGEMPFRSKPSDPRMLGRRLVSAALTPRATARMDQRIAEVVQGFAAPMRGRTGVVDVLAEYTFPVSRTVIGTILGVPPKGDDAERFRVLASSTSRGVNPIISERKRLESERSSIELCEYLLGLVAERRENPQDDLISDLLRASDTDVTAATIEDIVRTIGAMVSAGTITTGHASTRALRTLLHNPDQLELLRGQRSLVPGAVNELLRHHSGLFGFPRYVLEDFELGGRSLRKGQLVILSILAANRDPAVFPDPDRLDITRDTRESLSFGHGANYCIGSNLAFVQLCRILDAALDFLPPDARLLEDRIRWSARGIQARIKSLPVDFGGA